MSPAAVSLLVVDDDIPVRNFLCCVIAELGYHVRSAEDGLSALLKVREQRPDIIVSDMNMPGMSGFELLTIVRRRFPSIRTVAMSGAFSDSQRQPGVSADAFYQKGTPVGPLLRSVEALAIEAGEHTQLRRREPTLIWVPTNRTAISDVPYVTLSCPACMKVFSQVLDGTASFERSTACLHCGDEIVFAVIERTPPHHPPPVQMSA